MANVLWGHLRKDAGGWGCMPSTNPPLFPQDKTATSMRMLIHDTQSSLEKFSERLDRLMTRVDDCRCQVINANKLLENERDKMLTEMVDIASNSQRQLKTHVGTPAQKDALELVHTSQSATESNLRGLEKRIDALQTLFQSHTNAITSVQDQQKAIQNQQNALLNALLPLLPLLQNLPSQVDQLKSSFSETMSHATSDLENGIDSIKISLQRLPSVQQAPPKVDASPTFEEASSASLKRTISEVLDGHTDPSPECDFVSNSTPKRPRINSPPTSPPRTQHLIVSDGLAPVAQPQLANANPVVISQTSPSKGSSDLREPLVHPLSAGEQPPDYMCASIQPALSEDHVSARMPFKTTPQTPRRKESMPRVPLPPGPLAQFLPQNGGVARRPSGRCNLPPAGESRTNEIPSLKPAQTMSALVPSLDYSGFDAAGAALNITPRRRTLTSVSSPAQPIHSTTYPNAGRSPRVRVAGPQHLRNPRTRNEPLRTPRRRPTNHLSDAFSRLPPHDVSSKPPTASAKSSPKSMSLRDRRVQLSLLGRTQSKRFISLVPSSDEEE